MIEHLEQVRRWQAAGRSVAIAALVDAEGSAPRDPGAEMIVSDAAEIAGSVSGGCVEAALAQEAAAVLATGHARLVSYGIAEADAISAGLLCGGTIRVLVAPLDAALCAELEKRLATSPLRAMAWRLSGERAGAHLCIFGDGVLGTLGDPALDAALAADARASFARGAGDLRWFGERGEPAGEVEIFVRRYAPSPEMYVFGASDFAQAVVRVGKFLGYRVTLCDARAAFATRERFGEADEVVVAWPDEFLAAAPVDERTAIVVLTHDEKFDIPLLRAALYGPARYVGAIGSRRTHARRLRLLREAGTADAELARLRAPIGLDIGARTPAETAIAIAAEIVAQRNARPGGPLTGGEGPLRGRGS